MPNQYKVYWNNVCLLSKMEEEFISKAINNWQITKQDKFNFEYFGLGKQMKLNEKIAMDLNSQGVNAHALISTDLDVFQDQALLLNKLSEYKNLADQFLINKGLISPSIFYPSGEIQPSIVIPLVMVANTALLKEEEIPQSLEELTHPKWEGKITFGGMDTSAGKSVLMALWYLYGEEAVYKFIKNSTVQNVPAAAFNGVMRGKFPLALVPTIFAARGGQGNLRGIWPKEGAVAIPSYVAIKKEADDGLVTFLNELLFGREMQEFYSSRGFVIPVHPEVEVPQWLAENQCRTVYPEWDWIRNFDIERFKEICRKAT